MKDSTDRAKSLELVDQAMKLQLSGGGDLSEVEKCLRRALDLDPDSLAALREAAHFYDTVLPDHDKAHEYAIMCRDRAAQIVAEMEQILRGKRSEEDTQGKTLASRHIGGIIGPY